MRIEIVAAVARNGIIGYRNQLPWRLPGDLERFKQLTRGRPVIMGRHTFESIGRPLPERVNIVVTSNPHFWPDDTFLIAESFANALEFAMEVGRQTGVDACAVIGGQRVYEAAMDYADALRLTEVDAEPEGDTHFPLSACDNRWRESKRYRPEPNSGDSHTYTFVDLVRDVEAVA